MTNKIITLYQNLSYPMRKRYVFCLLYMCTCAIKSKVPSYKNGIFYQMFALFHWLVLLLSCFSFRNHAILCYKQAERIPAAPN
uniref:Uncharacterized protein n=1 Tax=Periophthalmus magnuspinnatus TaxID=409849 RepID=A0A3B3ZP88_9GOBI